MKKTLFIIPLIVLFFGCETQNDIESDLQRLKNKRDYLNSEISVLENTKKTKEQQIRLISEKLDILKIHESGRTPKYIIKVRLKQSHFSLNIDKHIKDAMNAIEFEIPVDEEFYNSVEVGTPVVDEFRFGSMILYGSFGSWKMRVISKEIR